MGEGVSFLSTSFHMPPKKQFPDRQTDQSHWSAMLGMDDFPVDTSTLHWLRTLRNLHFTRLQCFLISGEPIAWIVLPSCQAILPNSSFTFPEVHSQSESVSHLVVPSSLLFNGLWPPGSSVHGISQARTLAWVAISFSRGSSWTRDWPCISYTGRLILYRWATREAHSIQCCTVK